MDKAEQLARLVHETYERLAPEYGYETREDTRAFDPTSPNGRLMVAVCEAVRRERNELLVDMVLEAGLATGHADDAQDLMREVLEQYESLSRERAALRTGLLLITRDRNAPGWLRGYAQQVLDEGEKAR